MTQSDEKEKHFVIPSESVITRPDLVERVEPGREVGVWLSLQIFSSGRRREGGGREDNVPMRELTQS